MSTWTKARSHPGRTYQDAEEVKKLRADVKRVRELVGEGAEGNPEAEPAYVEIINKVEPEMTTKRRKELIMQFRDAVSDERRRRGLPLR